MQNSSGPPERVPSIVEAYIRAQEFLQKRTIVVGRLIREYGHHSLGMVVFPVAAAYLVGLNMHSVRICVGLSDAGKLIAVEVPAELFEHAGPDVIKDWVDTCNKKHIEMASVDMPSEADLLKRAGEMSILRELMAKYPEVATEG